MQVIKSRFFQYAVIVLLFGVWILFFDDYNWDRKRELKKQLHELQQELQETQKMIAEYETKNKMIETDTELMEATGRDNYYIKRADEDLFIILEEDDAGSLILLE